MGHGLGRIGRATDRLLQPNKTGRVPVPSGGFKRRWRLERAKRRHFVQAYTVLLRNLGVLLLDRLDGGAGACGNPPASRAQSSQNGTAPYAPGTGAHQ